MSGPNAHVIVESAPPRPAVAPTEGARLFAISARDETAARELGVHNQTAYKWVRSGELIAVKVGLLELIRS